MGIFPPFLLSSTILVEVDLFFSTEPHDDIYTGSVNGQIDAKMDGFVEK